uniref:Uncharacterized protein n=1 Tax=Megaviridae environmental sample TaxID=1737588 RepID=A0A5J6VK73_9VIRU|nr:MAG: hypothetical protein [Megaviridae environmental sample]
MPAKPCYRCMALCYQSGVTVKYQSETGKWIKAMACNYIQIPNREKKSKTVHRLLKCYSNTAYNK